MLSGCSGSSDFNDLQQYMDEVRTKPKGTIEPLPAFIPYEAFTYSAAALRHPFQPPVKLDLAQRQRGSKDIQPDESRVKQFLEGFNIENFSMVGTLANGGGRYALIKGAMVFTGSRLAITWGVTTGASSKSARPQWMWLKSSLMERVGGLSARAV